MGAFMSALGHGLEDYAKQRAMRSPVGRAISGGMQRYRAAHAPGSGYATVPPDTSSPQDSLGGMDAPQSPGDPTTAQIDADPSTELAGIVPDPMAQGRIVTKPTVALLGDKGSEAVIPLNAHPGNKVGMDMIGARRPAGPAMARYRPSSIPR